MRLIKFTSGEYLLENIEKGQLFFNNIFNMNDPFEGIFRYKLSSDKAKFAEFYLKYFSEPEKLDYYFENKNELSILINRTFEWRFKNNSICCFSDVECLTDILMWAHYSDKHKGVCLVFDEPLTFVTPPELNTIDKIVFHPTGPHKISYVENYLDEDPFEKKLTQRNFLTTKFKTWDYEKEYRFISPVSGAFRFDKNSLKEIVLGLNCDVATMEALTSILKARYSSVLLKKVSRIDSDFKLTIDDVNY